MEQRRAMVKTNHLDDGHCVDGFILRRFVVFISELCMIFYRQLLVYKLPNEGMIGVLSCVVSFHLLYDRVSLFEQRTTTKTGDGNWRWQRSTACRWLDVQKTEEEKHINTIQ
jgi:hypothetical protein